MDPEVKFVGALNHCAFMSQPLNKTAHIQTTKYLPRMKIHHKSQALGKCKVSLVVQWFLNPLYIRISRGHLSSICQGSFSRNSDLMGSEEETLFHKLPHAAGISGRHWRITMCSCFPHSLLFPLCLIPLYKGSSFYPNISCSCFYSCPLPIKAFFHVVLVCPPTVQLPNIFPPFPQKYFTQYNQCKLGIKFKLKKKQKKVGRTIKRPVKNFQITYIHVLEGTLKVIQGKVALYTRVLHLIQKI